MLSLEQKRQVFFATRTENYRASMRLEGIVFECAQQASSPPFLQTSSTTAMPIVLTESVDLPITRV